MAGKKHESDWPFAIFLCVAVLSLLGMMYTSEVTKAKTAAKCIESGYEWIDGDCTRKKIKTRVEETIPILDQGLRKNLLPR